MNVMMLLTCTIVFLPTLFIAMAAGMERSRNQMNTIDGMNPARVSLRLKSCFT